MNRIYKQRQLRLFGWRDGVGEMNIFRAVEGPDGKVWCGSYWGLICHDPTVLASRGTPCDTVREGPAWQGFEVEDSFLQDNHCNLWLLLKQQPGCISRFDGNTWKHFDLGFDHDKVWRHFVDDRDRVYMVSRFPADECFRMDLTGRLERFSDVGHMLSRAVEEGVARFKPSSSMVGPLVVPSGGTWGCFGSSKQIDHYDGLRLKTYPSKDGGLIEDVFSWADNTVIIRQQGNRFLRLEQETFVEVKPPRNQGWKWMIGEKGYQLLDEDSQKRNIGRLFPVCNRGGDAMIFDSLRDFVPIVWGASVSNAVVIETWASQFKSIRPWRAQ